MVFLTPCRVVVEVKGEPPTHTPSSLLWILLRGVCRLRGCDPLPISPEPFSRAPISLGERDADTGAPGEGADVVEVGNGDSAAAAVTLLPNSDNDAAPPDARSGPAVAAPATEFAGASSSASDAPGETAADGDDDDVPARIPSAVPVATPSCDAASSSEAVAAVRASDV